MALERLSLSPQCGLASTAPGNPPTPADQERKLRLGGGSGTAECGSDLPHPVPLPQREGEGASYCHLSSLDKLEDIAVRIFYHRDACTRADLGFWNSELNAFAFEFGTQVGQALDHEGDVTNAELFL